MQNFIVREAKQLTSHPRPCQQTYCTRGHAADFGVNQSFVFVVIIAWIAFVFLFFTKWLFLLCCQHVAHEPLTTYSICFSARRKRIVKMGVTEVKGSNSQCHACLLRRTRTERTRITTSTGEEQVSNPFSPSCLAPRTVQEQEQVVSAAL